ncbi:MAG: hypothetical protein U9N81_13940 [Bacillota bacterium]|nr:hypothetical protein [Bacillota bacterium]
MKGHIAFCPHFHQPHFQLYKTREEAYQNSYVPWLELLERAFENDSFFINLHFSGPFIYWIRDQKPWFQEKLQSLMASNKIGIIGGLADEPFIQLSSRSDDVLYQLQKYDEICSAFTGINAPDWQGIHLVERECGEFLLREVSRAAGLMDACPLYYLDAETFYQSHFSSPGGSADFCQKHFGFKDPFSKTTIAHVPQEMLYFALRDEIGGQVYYSVPVHTEPRYQLLKTGTFTPEDRTRIKPGQYLFYIKDALEKANEISERWGKKVEPILVIFEDAEKFGQWSKDPQGDTQWLLEFFQRVEDDPELQFTGLKDYFLNQGILDTYPARTSHSYPEWDNWMANRGIRGVTFGDERLRRVMSRLRLAEEKQNAFEEKVLDQSPVFNEGVNGDIIKRAVLESAERHQLVSNLIEEHFQPEVKADYDFIQRTRNMVYQEDPKWASRHPCYGSAPYYDMQGLAYLEIAERMLRKRLIELSDKTEKQIITRVCDWDFDGLDEVLVETPWQTLCIDMKGGCIVYHHVLAEDVEGCSPLLREDIHKVVAYNEVYRYSYPMVLTEADSKLCAQMYPEGGRRERCRNAFRCEVMVWDEERYKKLGDFEIGTYELQGVETDENNTTVVISASQKIRLPDGQITLVRVDKNFTIMEAGVEVQMEAAYEKSGDFELYLVPQMVSSAAPSDEVHFQPCSALIFEKGDVRMPVRADDIMQRKEESLEYLNANKHMEYPFSGQIDYQFQICNGKGDKFWNGIRYSLSRPESIKQLIVEPAVKQYYQGMVFPDQSRLGYHSSGVMLKPFMPFQKGRAEFGVTISWKLNQTDLSFPADNRLALIQQVKDIDTNNRF